MSEKFGVYYASSPWSRPSALVCTTTLRFYDEEVSSADILRCFLLKLLPKGCFPLNLGSLSDRTRTNLFHPVPGSLDLEGTSSVASHKTSQKSGGIGSDSKGSNLVFVY